MRVTYCFDCSQKVSTREINCVRCGAPPHNSSQYENSCFYTQEDDIEKLAEWDRHFNDLMDEHVEAAKRKPMLSEFYV